MPGATLFLERVLKSSPLDFSRHTPEERNDAAEAHWNTLFDRDGPRSIDREPTPREKWWAQRFFAPFWAIRKSHDQLEDIAVYIRRFPYRGTRVSPITHLRHNVQVYFQEVFVLRERLIQQLKPITDARRHHVHELGYDDEGLSRLGTLELLVEHAPVGESEEDERFSAVLRILYQDGYKQQRKQWVRSIRSWNSAIDKLLDQYCDIIGDIVFEKDGKLQYPQLKVD